MSRAAPIPALVELCRALRHQLDAGLTLVDVFRQQAKRGPSALRDVCEGIGKELRKGDDLEAALSRRREVFPVLFVELAVVGEQSGNLPEVFAELENYYRLVLRLRRELRSRMVKPVAQLVLGIGVVAFMIVVLGIVNPKFDALGLGLTGTSGAMLFLGITALAFGSFFLVVRTLLKRTGMGAAILRQPIVGPCLTAFALHRFSVALRLTTSTGMGLEQAVRMSLRATGSEAYASAAGVGGRAVEAGHELATALERTLLFPQEYLDIIAVAEESGRLDDVLEHQAKHYAEESERRLTTLTKALAGAVWFLIAAFLVFLIFRIAMTYINALNAFA